MIGRCLQSLLLIVFAWSPCDGADDAHFFADRIQPLLREYCLKCHSTEKHKGDLDLERFIGVDTIRSAGTVWQHVEEQLLLGEMPPEKKPQLPAADKAQLLAWLRGTLTDIARETAGDPGPVLLRRLSNMEYTYTLRDLTGISSLNPAAEFPVDGAAGEGFTNAGAALVMSPALLEKYYDAAQEVASHLVLLPAGISFSEKTTRRDWAAERLVAIRAFYGQFTDSGNGRAINLQGIKFETKDGGILPLEKYLLATVEEREVLQLGGAEIAEVAARRGLNSRYLTRLWATLNDTAPSVLLDSVRAQWRTAKPEDVAALVTVIQEWQARVWRFANVGHIGKRDGPTAWHEPISPLLAVREVNTRIPVDGDVVTLYLKATDAGNDSVNDEVVWQRPRVVLANGREVALADLAAAEAAINAGVAAELQRTTAYLSSMQEARASGRSLADIAAEHRLLPGLLANWADLVMPFPGGTPEVAGLYTEKIANGGGHAEINGWGSSNTPSVIANASQETFQITTVTVPGRSVIIHPSPTLDATICWRSPIAGRIRVNGRIADTDGNCGNGVGWRVEVCDRLGAAPIAAGTIDNGGNADFASDGTFSIKQGDLVKVSVSARDGKHSCDSTQVDLVVTETAGEFRVWNLATDVVDRIEDGNPVDDSRGNPNIWYFGAVAGAPAADVKVAAGSVLADWRQAVANERGEDVVATAALAVQTLLTAAAEAPQGNPADATMRQKLLNWQGPLNWLTVFKGSSWATAVNKDLEMRAPAVLTFSLPARLVNGGEFKVTGLLHPVRGKEGSVQLQASFSKPERTAVSRIIVAEGSKARERLMAEIDAFRLVFPAALCYTKIVPTDEVVTLALYHREDEPLQRLFLDERQIAELDKMWDELHFVSQDALQLVDVFEQLWQYATQDADPTVFEPLRIPIARNAAAFRERALAAEPGHVDAILKFAERAWRQPLTAAEKARLVTLYRGLRDQGMAHDEAARAMLARVLVAPAFLYKLETPAAGKAATSVSDYELAVRLSYFLWSTTPDVELTELAAAGKLQDPDVLAAQAARMLKDDRVRHLAIEFGCQWLHTRNFDSFDEKSNRHFPEFADIRSAFNEEPIRFFTDFFQQNGAVTDLLAADYTFVNGKLAAHYGLQGIAGEEWRRVDHVREQGRGGVLGFGAVLARQSGASRTSPILRGNWISETLLGERLPRPPKGVPVLAEEPQAGLTERELTARHSSDPKCARCHQRIDPLGFALEGFDAIGRARSRDAAGLAIDTHAQVADGTAIDGLPGLRDYLLNKRGDTFERQFCRKLLGYALGRGVMLSDEPLLDAMQSRLAENDHRVAIVVDMIVRSRQFREIRGRDFEEIE